MKERQCVLPRVAEQGLQQSKFLDVPRATAGSQTFA